MEKKIKERGDINKPWSDVDAVLLPTAGKAIENQKFYFAKIAGKISLFFFIV